MFYIFYFKLFIIYSFYSKLGKSLLELAYNYDILFLSSAICTSAKGFGLLFILGCCGVGSLIRFFIFL